ncbi:flagellar filament capping protein FliD [Sulfuritalea hydrogenivorans]|jgi:flagellar hook-associated protein 2|uniref:Flagellar hook-associated protein 2 n=1 Tax=Sulfuritalea hydrogenivorans sk43H TaxID=1223802 RepID=W0SCL0_9PROT|nr:flagellar filament capping protein FliD [Sulfuritalea hydrogenivorans]MDK9715008.1 flagellar filament capping protein FliD [Sulfuritalea sp.]BAO28771.1 flagellar hook-associated 2 domain-containing protein [Sulfuritalea hydrogenivorans sk43H]
MASISSAGIGSGLDVNGIVTQLMAVEKQPLTALDTKEAGYQSKLTTFGTLKSSVASLQSAARALKSSSLYASMSAKTGDSSVFSASANTAAQAASYSLQVVARAQAQAISSQAFSSITTDVGVADGKIKIELGTFSGGVFTADPDKTATTIEIGATSSSLEEIRDAINDSGAGVRANLVYVGNNEYKLTVTSESTGAKNSIKLTVLDTSDVVQNNNTGLAKLSFNPAAMAGAGNEFEVNTTAQDAHFKIDGLDVYRTTNSVSDAITGVTLSLTGVGTTTLTVSKDSASAKSALDSFVKAYNDIAKQLRDATAYNASTKQASILTGDSGARSLQTALREMIGYSRSSTGSNYSTLSDLGVALQRDGSLVFNSSKFETAMASSTTNVGDLLSSTSTNSPGIAVRMTKTLDGILSSTGLLASRTEGINRSIADVGDQRERLARRLVQIEARYRKQFSALDTLVASMQKTSQYLTQQLANLPSTTS